MDEERFARVLRRLEASGIAALSDLVGCTSAEIEVLEERYGFRLPRTYRRYLEVMGRRSGRLFTCDHAAVFYPYVLSMTDELRENWAEAGGAVVSASPVEFELAADALLINGRLGEYFEFIRCRGQDDSPVWSFTTWEWQVREVDPSVLAWLESWCAEAEKAIASGYYDEYPDGTTP